MVKKKHTIVFSISNLNAQGTNTLQNSYVTYEKVQHTSKNVLATFYFPHG